MPPCPRPPLPRAAAGWRAATATSSGNRPGSCPWAVAAAGSGRRARPSPTRPAAPAGAALRRRRPVGRRRRPGRVARPRPCGAGRPDRRLGGRSQRLPQEGGARRRRAAAVVRPAGQGRELPGAASPSPTPPPAAVPRWTTAAPGPGAGPRTASGAAPVTSPRASGSGRSGGSRWTSGTAARPHGGGAAGGAFGRVLACRAARRDRRARSVPDVPGNPRVRDRGAAPRPRQRPGGRQAKPPLRRAGAWAALPPAPRRQRIAVRPGAKGPLVVAAVAAPRVRTPGAKGPPGPAERLAVSRGTAAAAETWYTRSTAAAAVPLAAVVCARGARHQAAVVLQPGRGAAGLDHYAVRGRPGGHHHMTPAPRAPGFLAPERSRRGGEKAGPAGGASAGDRHAAAARPAAAAGANRRRNQRRAAAEGGGGHRSLAPQERRVPPAAEQGPAQEGTALRKRVTVELAGELLHLPHKAAGVATRLGAEGISPRCFSAGINSAARPQSC